MTVTALNEKKSGTLAAKIEAKQRQSGMLHQTKEKATAELEEANNDIEKIYRTGRKVTRNGVTIQPPMKLEYHR